MTGKPVQDGPVTPARPARTLACVAQPGGIDGSTYYRMHQPWKQLVKRSRHQFEIPEPLKGQGHPLPELGRMLESADVYVCQRSASPMMTRFWEQLGGKVARVFETDDDLLSKEPSQLIPDLMTSQKRAYLGLMAMAELVTVSTPWLGGLISGLNPRVAVLPNMVHERLLSIARPRRDKVTAGFCGGSSHMPDWAYAGDAVGEALEATGADMHFVGVDYSPLIRREARFTPWNDDLWRYYLLIDFDVAVAPLAPLEFNNSKSHLRALEAAALGIPVVASDLPPYRDFVIDGVTGYLCKTPDEMRDRLTGLLSDQAAREEMGAKAREVAAGYTIQGNWQLWEQAYEAAVK